MSMPFDRKSIVALIPARGGSKRLPKKNIRLFAGRPLLEYSIAVAQAAPEVSRCVVSTDDSEIAFIAERCGAEVVHRPPELSDDRATTASVAVHTLHVLGAHSLMPDVLLVLQPTCPLRPANLISDALRLLADGDADSVVSVSELRRKIGEIEENLFVPGYVPGSRSQDLPRRYFENGLVYATWTRVVVETGSLFGARVRPLIIEPLYALGDIDTGLDFAVAEMLFERFRDHFDWAARPATI